MDVYASIFNSLSKVGAIRSCPAMRSILQRATASRPRDWQLPELAYNAVSDAGAKLERAIPVAAAIACLQISIILVDDMLDADPGGEYQSIGSGAAANLAVAFQAAALEVIIHNPQLTPRAKLAIVGNLNQMALTTAVGQYLDTQKVASEADYWRVVAAKSGAFFGTALQVGALAADTEIAIQAAPGLKRLGKLYGEMIQIHDDLNDTMAQPAGPDWLCDRSPLPILFAKTISHPAQNQFLQLCRTITDPGALAQAQRILLRCGAVSYCLAQLMLRFQQAKQMLTNIPLVNKQQLSTLLANVAEPAQALLAAPRAQPKAVTSRL